ncbi:hypothetical protein PAXRUDRAFT_28997 [Paxillus rubicundulus Ve08.2h10]|uniref:Uncharacterized protein n=1 Tax=Paxillus rubicundulus Ve08.2h10 TaxID=930991 RepID=A0A0D0D7E0_9AGAM|nr:hypothetical protein PAXRUDRAFT_28997 [Paxillus rubicundulus Ve08.2h10]
MDVGRDDEFDNEEEFTPGCDLNSTDDGMMVARKPMVSTNEGLADILPSCTVPQKSAKAKQKSLQHQAAQVAHEKGIKTTSKGGKGGKLKNAYEVEAGLPLLSVGNPPIIPPSSLSHSQEVLGTLFQKKKQAQVVKSHWGCHHAAVYPFFKEVDKDKNGNVGMKETKFYQSIHGTFDIISLMAKMNLIQTGMEILRSWSN